MRPPHPLITTNNFSIERIAPCREYESHFELTLLIAGNERRDIYVANTDLLNFIAFRSAALRCACVVLRHEAEDRTPEGRRAWLDLIDEAIRRSATKQTQHSRA